MNSEKWKMLETTFDQSIAKVELKIRLDHAWTRWGAKRLIRRAVAAGTIDVDHGKNMLIQWEEMRKLTKEIR